MVAMPGIKVSDKSFRLLFEESRDMGVQVKQLADMIIALYFNAEDTDEEEE
tara:strand:+ start:127 stop:279 length:153 start_codon:yes stop_codon:yes gene_type:complete